MDDQRFIFDWSRTRWKTNWRLGILVFASLIGHVVVFYLFQVSYPPTERWTPRTRGVMLLSSLDPISAQVLRELDDQTFHLQGAGAAEVPAYSLTKMSPKFRPSFFGHQPTLREIASPAREEAMPTLLAKGRMELPPLRAGPAKQDNAAALGATGGEFVEIRGGIESDSKTPELEILAELRQEIARAPGAWRWLRLRVLLSGDGVIRNLLTESIDEGTASPRALEKIRQGIRFPEGGGRRWGWIEVRR